MPNIVSTVELNYKAHKKAIFICGPTAVGKTGTAIEIARWLDTDIISFDSRQFFRELKIGAAPPSPEEMSLVRHHLTGHLSIRQDYNAGDFETEALAVMDEIFKTKDATVLAGGSGLYMKALTEGFDDMPDTGPEQRSILNQELETKGLEPLQKELSEKDPDYYDKADIRNPQRVIRALEIIRSTGRPYSSFRKNKKAERPFRIIKIGLDMPREALYDRINKRVDKMVLEGLVEEAEALKEYRQQNALQTVGYKELFAFFDGQYDLNTAISEIKKNSRRYAKRQLTWFRRDEDIQWFHPDDTDQIKKYIESS